MFCGISGWVVGGMWFLMILGALLLLWFLLGFIMFFSEFTAAVRGNPRQAVDEYERLGEMFVLCVLFGGISFCSDYVDGKLSFKYGILIPGPWARREAKRLQDAYEKGKGVAL